MKKKLLLLVLFFWFICSFADQAVHFQFVDDLEKVSLTTDRHLYLSGEKIWFSVAVSQENKPYSSLSTVIYLELISENKQSVVQQKMSIRNGLAHGKLLIPENIESGSYFFRAYTRFQLNQEGCEFSGIFLTILNPEAPLPAAMQKNDDGIDSSENQSTKIAHESNMVRINLPKQHFQAGDSIRINIENIDNQAINAQIAVVLKGTETTDPFFVHAIETKKSSQIKSFLPETRDLTLRGLVRDISTKQPIDSCSVFVSVLGQQPQLHHLLTDKAGNFTVSLRSLYGVQSLFCGAEPTDNHDVEVMIHQDFAPADCMNRQFPEVKFGKSSNALIQQMLLNREVSKSFISFPDLVQQAGIPQRNQYFGKPDQIVYPADFVDLESFEEVFKEIVPFVKIKRNKENYYFEVIDSQRNMFYNHPLVMVDQIPIFDVESLFTIQPKRIAHIDLINQPYQYGETTFYGIIQIITNTRDFASIHMPEGSVFIDYQCLEPESEPSEILHSVHLPSFRTSLYWNPELLLEKGINTLSFPASDNKGEFKIVITRHTEHGIELLSESLFEIR